MLVVSGVESGDASTAALGQLHPALGDVIGNILTAIGHGTIRRANGTPVQVLAGDPVCPGDMIETAADGRIEIRFIDGTAFSLSGDTSVVVGGPARNSTIPLRSTLIEVTRGAFAFAGGELANTDPLTVETPFGSIRSRTQASGFAMLSLAALTFSFVKEALAADPDVTFLDDDTITYKELHHGVFELTTKEANPRHIIVEDPGETVVLSRRGSSVSVDTVANTPAQMQALQMAQQAALDNYAKGWGSVGSSTPPSLNPGDLLQPINFFQPDPIHPLNLLPPLQTAIFQPIEVGQPTLAITSIGGQIDVAGDDIINAAKADAGIEIVGATTGVANGLIVKVFIIDGSDNIEFSGTAIVSNGSWAIVLSPEEAKALVDGIYTLKADVTNQFGNTAEASQPIRVDETPPTIAIDPVARSNVVNAETASAGFTIVGTATDAENGQPVTVRIIDSSGNVVDTFVTKLTDNTWSINVTSAEAKLLHDGSYTVTADVSDSAGNPAPEATQVIRVDETLPTVTWLPQAESGVEGAAIALGTIAASASSLPGNSVQSLVVSGIPIGAVLTDGTNSFVATSDDTSVDVRGWTLSNLKITPPNDTNFTLTVTATDQDANTSSASELVTVTPLAPTLNPVAAQGNENTAIALDLGATAQSLLGDASPNHLAALLVSDIPVGATLTDGSGHSFTATAGNTAEDVAGWNLSSLTITPPAEFEGNFTLAIAVNERDPEGDLSATVTATVLVKVNPVAEPPTISAPPTLTLNENANGVTIAGVSVGPLAEDSDDTVSATLAVSHGILHVAGLDGVTVTGDDSGMLTLSGSAALVNALLAQLTYTPTTEYEGSDALRISVASSDGSNTYPGLATATTVITVNPVAEPPTACAPPTLTLNENANGVAIAGVSVGPLAEDSDDTVSATLAVSHGILHVAGLDGVTVTGDDSGMLTLSGSAALVNALLAQLTYTPTTEYEGSDTLRISVSSSDGSNTYPALATASTAITVNPVAEPPTVSAPATLTLNENSTGVAIAGVSVGPLAEDSDDTVSATLAVSHGILHVAGLDGVTVTGDDSGMLTLSGSAALVNALLAQLTYTPTAEYEGSDTLRMSVTSSDGSDTYPGLATASTAITVNPVAEPPTASAPATITVVEHDDGDFDNDDKVRPIQIQGVVAGPAAEDADDTIRVLLTVAHGTLAVIAVAGVTEIANGSGYLTLSGTASEVNAALASLVYTPTEGFFGSDTLNVTVTSIDGTDIYPTPATAVTAITVTTESESLIVGGPAPTLDWSDAANWSAGVVPTLTISTFIGASALYTVIIDDIAQAASLTIPHGSAMTNITASGTLQLAGNLDVSDSGKLENDGRLEETASGTFIGPIINNGTIIVDQAVNLDVTGTITGNGKFSIGSGGTLEFAAGSKVAPGTTDSQTISFEQGAGKLIIDDWGKFAGVITGTDIGTQLTSTDLIDLTQLPFVGGSMSVSVSYNSGTNVSTMTFSDGNGANDVTLHLSGNYTGTAWTFTSINGGAGTEISDPPPNSGTITGHIAVATAAVTAASALPAPQTLASPLARLTGDGSPAATTTATGLWVPTPGSAGTASTLGTGNTLAGMIIVGLGANLPTGGSDTVFHSHAANSSATGFDTITNFVSGSDKIDLTSFGSFSSTILTLSPGSTSVPAHTIAWLYDGNANQALVYANPTDHAVGIGDSSLVAIHLPGVANLHSSDFALATTTAAPVVVSGDPIDHAATTHDDAVTSANHASGTTSTTQASPDTKVSYDAPLADGDNTTQAASIPTSFGAIDGPAMALPGGLTVELTQIAMTALMQPGFTFDPKPAFDNANPTPVAFTAVNSDWFAPSWSDWNDNPDTSPKNGGHDASHAGDVANAGNSHAHDADADAVPDAAAPKTSTNSNGNGKSEGHGNKTPADDHGDGNGKDGNHHAMASDASGNTTPQHRGEASPPWQHKSVTTSNPEGPAINDAAKPNEPPTSKGHHGDAAVTHGSQVNPEGGEASGSPDKAFIFKDAISNSKGSSVTDLAQFDATPAPSFDYKGNVPILASHTEDAIGLSPHDQHSNHGASVHVPHDLII
ncbi:Ig-like domain-containing protein [Bradyrhizobium jicamae]|uniref:Ig-like domain-containing protein n=1 Tax=Bradyrhizobium jicamae TaxID=280332 RepID=UPI001BA45832|nr:Ig-like domain-containing protein [Bradyrhizobium jicamae]MBR0938283.1 FecR domain-containing protein [Bradyrhizobium jicamae]